MSETEKIAREPGLWMGLVGALKRVWAAARRRPAFSAAALFTLLTSSIVAAHCFDEFAAPGLPRGTSVLGLALSHVELEEARARLQPLSQKRDRRAMKVEADGKSSALIPETAGLRIDVGRTLRAVLEEREKLGPPRRFWVWLTSLVQAPPEARLLFAIDAKLLDAELDRVERELLTLPFVGGFRFEGQEVFPEFPRSGRRLSKRAATERVLSGFAEGRSRVLLPTEAAAFKVSPEAVAALVVQVRSLVTRSVILTNPPEQSLEISTQDLRRMIELVPDTLTTQAKLRVNAAVVKTLLGSKLEQLESPPTPARFSIDAKDQVEIVPSRPAQRLDPERVAEAIMQAAESPERTSLLPFSAGAEPELTTEVARALSIRGLVSSFSTRHPCCERRVENIHRIADLLDGLLVKPGETVSLNAVVGPRTKQNGFVPAPSIEEGEMVDSLGGGISQFATTLFNALFHGGYAIVERQPHSYWFPRYPMGHEATLSFPKPDLVFRNDTQSGLLIDTVYTPTKITVRLFGDNEGRKVRARVSPRQDVVDPPGEIIGNPSLAPDQEQTVQAGTSGWSVIVARIVEFPDGTKREDRRKVTYRARPRRVEVHPCRVPRGEKGYTGEPCPDLAETPAEAEAMSDDGAG